VIKDSGGPGAVKYAKEGSPSATGLDPRGMPSVFGETLLIARDQAVSEIVAEAGRTMRQFRDATAHCENHKMEFWPQLGIHAVAQ